MAENSPRTGTTTPPRVYISYTHESADHKARVRALADQLREDGVNATIDQYEIAPPEGWPRWMERQILEADFVLMICTEAYYRRVMGEEEGDTGFGVRWEGKVIYQHIYTLGTQASKFIPVLMDGGNAKNIPVPLRALTYYELSTQEDYERLYRRLMNEPEAVPPVGQRREFFQQSTPRPANEASPRSPMTDRRGPPDAQPSLTVDALAPFVLTSKEASEILRRAEVLGTFGNQGEPKVTSTCLLFAISEGGRDQGGSFRTPQFFWRELQRADPEAYRRIFRERFPRALYSSAGDETVAFDRSSPTSEEITDNVLKIFRRAAEIDRATKAESSKSLKRPAKKGRDAGEQSHGVGARHLLAALMTEEETNAFERLSRILDVAQLRNQFLEFIQRSLPDDNFEAWQEILGASLATATEDETAITSDTEQDFRPPLAGFSADYWEGEDLLGITRDVNALASLVAARSIDPPLSIGLFGDWGSGKTHFMRQMRARVQKLSQKARDSGEPQSELGYHKKIVQIEFNAWHYIEGNLWASLVEHIFDNLRVTGQRDGRTEVHDAREKIMEQLGLKQELQKKVEQHQEELKTKAEAAKGRAEEARNKRDDKTDDLSKLRAAPERGLMDELPKIQVSQDQQALLKELGIPEGTRHLPSEIYKKYKQAQTTWGRLRAQWDVFRTDPNRMSQLIRILVVVAITVAVGVIFRSALKSAWGYLASIVAFVAAAWKAAKPYVEKFKQGMVALEKEYVEVEKARQKQIVELESEVNSLTREMNAAENEAKALNKEVSTLETQLKSTDAARLLAGFIESRAACEDYRRHLGVLALIRRDFEKLSNLLSEQRRDEREHGDATEDQKAFSRIILYIDDLDRCPPERVVQVLQAIHLLLAFPLFVVVVGVDARWVTRSLQESYDWLGVNGDEDKNKNKEDEREPNQDKREMVDDRIVTPHDYLEKIFQIPFWLKPMGETDCANLLDGLTKESRGNPASQNGDPRQAEAQGTTAAGADTTDGLAVSSAASEPVADPTLVRNAEPESGSASNQSAVNATNANDGDPAVAVAQAAGNQKELKVDAANEEQIDLAPQSLTLSEGEIEFMKSLTTLIGRSPRAVKRFLNCYRLIKVGLRPGELEVFMGQNGQPARYPAIMLLLGIITGAPSISLHIVEELEAYVRSKKTINLNMLLTRLEQNPEVVRQSDWIRVREMLEDKIGFEDSGVTLANLMQETPRVSRYSFRVAKTVAERKRTGAGKTTKAGPSGTVAQPVAS